MSASAGGRPMSVHPAGGTSGSRPCENSNDAAAVYEFQSVFGVFGHYRLGRAKKFAPDSRFSDNFRVFTHSGSVTVGNGRSRGLGGGTLSYGGDGTQLW